MNAAPALSKAIVWSKWQLAHALGRVNALHLCGVACIAFDLTLVALSILPLQQQVQYLREAHQVRRTAASLESARPQQASSPATPARAALHGNPPSDEMLLEQLAMLHRFAAENQLTILRSGYATEAITELSLHRVTIHMELLGPYPAQRRMLNRMLTLLGNLAIEQLSLEKSDAQGEPVTQRLVASLYYRPSANPR